MKRRRQKLDDSLRWHQFEFDADCELQWIKEREHLVASEDYGKFLTDAQALHAKHKVCEIISLSRLHRHNFISRNFFSVEMFALSFAC